MHHNGVHSDDDDGGNVVDVGGCCNVAEGSLSIILSEETDNSHIFGEQSLLAVSADLSLQPRRASFQCCKTSKAAAWQGSCTSFLSSNSDILNLSSSLNESNESTWHLTLNKLDHTLRNKTPTESHSTGTKANETTEAPSMKHRETSSMNSESRFSSSFLRPEYSDLLPRKPKHDTDYDGHNKDDEDDENDAGFTDIITENPYEEMFTTTLTETMTIMEQSSQVPDSTLSFLSNEHSSRNHKIPHPSVTTRPSEAKTTAVIVAINSSSSSSSSTEDKTPKRPMRRPSPVPICG